MGHMRLGSAENSSTTNSDNELYSRISHPLAGRRRTPGPLAGGTSGSEAQAQRLVVDPVHLVSWGGGLMPPVSSLEPRIREKALYSFYLPKLAEDGHSDEVLNRCVARATGKGLQGGSRSASVGALRAQGQAMPPAQASSHSCSWMQHSHSLAHGRSESSLGVTPRSGRRPGNWGPQTHGPAGQGQAGARSEARSAERRRSSPGPGRGLGSAPLGYLAGPESQWGPLARMLQKRSSV